MWPKAGTEPVSDVRFCTGGTGRITAGVSGGGGSGFGFVVLIGTTFFAAAVACADVADGLPAGWVIFFVFFFANGAVFPADLPLGDPERLLDEPGRVFFAESFGFFGESFVIDNYPWVHKLLDMIERRGVRVGSGDQTEIESESELVGLPGFVFSGGFGHVRNVRRRRRRRRRILQSWLRWEPGRWCLDRLTIVFVHSRDRGGQSLQGGGYTFERRMAPV